MQTMCVLCCLTKANNDSTCSSPLLLSYSLLSSKQVIIACTVDAEIFVGV